MKNTRKLWRVTAGTLLSAGVALAGLGLAAGSAQADTGYPHHWCPGSKDPTAPGRFYDWDWNICHTYYWTNMQGNVPWHGQLPSMLWDGPNPPPNSKPPCGTDMFTGRPGKC